MFLNVVRRDRLDFPLRYLPDFLIQRQTVQDFPGRLLGFL